MAKPTKLLRRDAWMDIIFHSDSSSISNIARESDRTYSHIIKILRILEDKGLVIMKKQGRQQLCVLTAKGKKVKDAISVLDRHALEARNQK